MERRFSGAEGPGHCEALGSVPVPRCARSPRVAPRLRTRPFSAISGPSPLLRHADAAHVRRHASVRQAFRMSRALLQARGGENWSPGLSQPPEAPTVLGLQPTPPSPEPTAFSVPAPASSLPAPPRLSLSASLAHG